MILNTLKMLKKLGFLALVITLFSSCTQEVEAENARLKAELDSLKVSSADQESAISDFMSTFDEVQSNLDSIRSREESIREVRDGSSEFGGNRREKLIADIEAINSLLEENQSTIEDLRRKLAASRGDTRKFEKLVASLNRQIEQKNEEIAMLYTQLKEANFQIDQLNSKVGMLTEAGIAQKKRLDQQDSELHKAYYTMGTYKELKEAGVVNKEGGFIGIGRTETLAEDFNTEYFTQIDIRNSTNLSFNGDYKKVELITNHSSDSYVYEMDGEVKKSLKITNPELFWENSKYLVILLD